MMENIGSIDPELRDDLISDALDELAQSEGEYNGLPEKLILQAIGAG